MDKVLETFLEIFDFSLGIFDFSLGNLLNFLADKVVAQLGTSVPPQSRDIEVQDDILESHSQWIYKANMKIKSP